jgi:FemAB-related protein (PEP-CTERM system-associated)
MRSRLTSLTASDVGRWDAFVRAHPEGTFFHLAGWRTVIERAFRHPTYYVYTEREGQVTGVLPLVHVKSRLFGDSLISNAFCVYGGPIAADNDSRAQLVSFALAEMERLQVNHVEFRNRRASEEGWSRNSGLYATFRREIDSDPEKNLQLVPRKQRAVIRQSLSNDLEAYLDQDVSRFYQIYAESVRNLGTPVFPKTYFRLLFDIFSGSCEITTVLFRGKPVSSVLSFFFNDEVLPYYGGGTFAARALGANDFMYWNVMSAASANGYRVFDFGRSKIGTGSFNFKKNWGFVPENLIYDFKLRMHGEIPNINPLNPKYRFLIETWKRLPVPVTKLIGPPITRGLG